MADGPQLSDGSGDDYMPPQDPVRKRRAQVEDEQVDSVTFTHKGLSKERMEALRQFLKHASSDEIAAVRKMYGDTPEVLRMIGLEILPNSLLKIQTADRERT